MFFDLVSIETKCALDRLKEWAIIPNIFSDKIIVLGNGYNEYLYRYVNNIRDNVVLIVARVSREKGIEEVVDALYKAGDNARKWKIIVVGPIEDRRYYSNIMNKARDYGIDVEFVGSKNPEELVEYYSRASLFALASYKESYGLVRLEAAASGLPVITTDTPCRSDLEELGFVVVSVGDVDELAARMKELIESEKLRRSVVDRQLGSVRSWKEVVEELISVIRGRFRGNCRL